MRNDYLFSLDEMKVSLWYTHIWWFALLLNVRQIILNWIICLRRQRRRHLLPVIFLYFGAFSAVTPVKAMNVVPFLDYNLNVCEVSLTVFDMGWVYVGAFLDPTFVGWLTHEEERINILPVMHINNEFGEQWLGRGGASK